MVITFFRHYQTALLRVRSLTRTMFSDKYLLLTNMGLSMGLSGSGDLLQQHYQIIKNNLDKWDPWRTRNMACSGLTVGFVCHHWYLYLDRKLPGRTLKVVLKKVLLDQILFSPVYISVFFITVGLLERSGLSLLKEEMLNKGSTLYIAEWIVWPPAQIFNFLFLPTRFRVLYDNTISLGFDCYFSYVKHSKED